MIFIVIAIFECIMSIVLTFLKNKKISVILLNVLFDIQLLVRIVNSTWAEATNAIIAVIYLIIQCVLVFWILKQIKNECKKSILVSYLIIFTCIYIFVLLNILVTVKVIY